MCGVSMGKASVDNIHEDERKVHQMATPTADTIASRFVTSDHRDFFAPFGRDEGALFETTKRSVFDADHKLVGVMASPALAEFVARQLTKDAEHGGGLCDHFDYEGNDELPVDGNNQCVLCRTTTAERTEHENYHVGRMIVPDCHYCAGEIRTASEH